MKGMPIEQMEGAKVRFESYVRFCGKECVADHHRCAIHRELVEGVAARSRTEAICPGQQPHYPARTDNVPLRFCFIRLLVSLGLLRPQPSNCFPN